MHKLYFFLGKKLCFLYLLTDFTAISATTALSFFEDKI